MKNQSQIQNNRKIAIHYYFPFWLWTISLLIGTSIPGSVLKPPPLMLGDKIIHLLAYTGVGFLLRRSAPFFKSQIWQKSPVLMTFILGSLIGIADEIHQTIIPGRFFEFADMIADILGVILGIFLYSFLIKRIPGLE